ncbi:C25 family cysteine peptidase [Rubritalea tangerina]|uniref:C25 family cysteine peptidase n=1 Tax=Rubritalea tangerina TaxID=430798 RepID=A0ABW4Z969_9BACT
MTKIHISSLIGLLGGAVAHASTGSAMVTKDVSKIDEAVQAAQPLYSQSGTLKSLVPEKMKAGQTGYLIATSEYIKTHSKALAAFIKHKESRGFKVHVATEKDWGVVESGKGRKQADRVHQWMQENYKKLNLLYTLIIENPHPDEGLIPMAKFKPRKYKVPAPEAKKDYAKYLKYKDKPRTEDGKYLLYDGSDPSDYYYADLTSNWDANGNSILAEKADYATGEIDCVAEVYVGRIPYYGEDHAYSNLAGVDKILRRTIEYELGANGDTAWRNDIFYVGGADKRFKKIQDQFLPYSGGRLETYRVSQGYGYEPTSSKWNGEIIQAALNADKPYGFINFQEHGSPTSMAGQMSTAKAKELKRTQPSYVYLGGCDVASPEHSDNVTNALFNHIGIAAVGATRSVTSMGGDDDTDSAAGYERLYFGQSTGEAHWRLLSDYADGMKKVGASNFLMNLMGDPSVVVMPKVNEDPLVVGPNMDVLKFRHQEKNRTPIGYTMVVRNQSSQEQQYTVHTSGALIAEDESFKLAPYSSRKLRVLFNDAHQLSVGEHSGSLEVKTLERTVERQFVLDVYARTTVLNLAFNTPAERKILGIDAKGEKAEMIKKYLAERSGDDFVSLPKGTRGDLSRTKVVPGESDVTVAARLRYETAAKGQLQFFKFGKTFECFDASILDGKFYVIFRTVKGLAEKETEGRIEVPAPAAGEWFDMVASVNRSAKTMTLIVNGKRYTAAFAPEVGQGLAFDKIRFGYGKNRSAINIDAFTIFDYALGEREVQTLASGDIIKQSYPKNGDKANPQGVNVSWNYSGKKENQRFVVVYATDASFSDRKYIETNDSNALLADLSDNTTYFWKVGFVKNGNKSFPWESYTTFTTDGSIQDVEVTINDQRQLRAATVGDNNFSEKLTKCVTALLPPDSKGRRKKAELFFTKLEGEDWLRCHSDGTLTTNFGAPKAGEYRFKFSVSTRYGIPKTFEKTIIAK